MLASDRATKISSKLTVPRRQPVSFKGGPGVRHQHQRPLVRAVSKINATNTQNHTASPYIAMNSATSCEVVLATAVMTMALAGLAP